MVTLTTATPLAAFTTKCVCLPKAILLITGPEESMQAKSRGTPVPRHR